MLVTRPSSDQDDRGPGKLTVALIAAGASLIGTLVGGGVTIWATASQMELARENARADFVREKRAEAYAHLYTAIGSFQSETNRVMEQVGYGVYYVERFPDRTAFVDWEGSVFQLQHALSAAQLYASENTRPHMETLSEELQEIRSLGLQFRLELESLEDVDQPELNDVLNDVIDFHLERIWEGESTEEDVFKNLETLLRAELLAPGDW